jgi:hypothetical protein
MKPSAWRFVDDLQELIVEIAADETAQPWLDKFGRCSAAVRRQTYQPRRLKPNIVKLGYADVFLILGVLEREFVTS